MKIRHIYNSSLVKWFFPKWVGAFTFGSTIFFRGSSAPLALILHETTHIKQYYKYTIPGFLFIYFKDYLVNLIKYKGDTMKAYRNIPFEIEAQESEKILR